MNFSSIDNTHAPHIPKEGTKLKGKALAIFHSIVTMKEEDSACFSSQDVVNTLEESGLNEVYFPGKSVVLQVPNTLKTHFAAKEIGGFSVLKKKGTGRTQYYELPTSGRDKLISDYFIQNMNTINISQGALRKKTLKMWCTWAGAI